MKEKRKNYCLLCGKEITGKDRLQKKFCNSSCSATFNNSKRGAWSQQTKDKISSTLKETYKNNPRQKAEKREKEIKCCIVCGNQLKSNRQKYCSKKCKNHKQYIDGINRYKCVECGKEFKSSNKQRKFCSSRCSADNRNRKLLEEWLIGKYSIDANTAIPNFIRKFLFEQSNNKCSECGFEGYNKSTNRTILQIHHVDGNSGNNHKSNLKVLCPNCHAMTGNYMALNKGNSARDKRYKKEVNKKEVTM